jgi:subtilisin family serine protease
MKKNFIGIFIFMLLIGTCFVININADVCTGFTYSEEDGAKTGISIYPNDPDFVKQWYLHNTGQNIPISGEGTPDADIDAPEAWDIETGSPDVVIAIIDCGIDYTHPDLADNLWNNEDEIPDNDIDDDSNGFVDDILGWNFYDGNNDLLDSGGHGTAHAGVIAAVANNGIGIVGVCWNCKIMPIHCLDELDGGDRTDVALGIRYAVDNGADIISFTFGDYFETDEIRDAVDYAYEKGIVMTSSAGNDGRTSEFYPAAYENVIGVGWTDNTDTKADVIRWGDVHGESNYGDWVDVSGPGVDIFTTMPTYQVTYNLWLGLNKNYDYLSGSSFSAPITAGIAGLLLSKNPQLTPDQVKAIICDNVDPYISDVYIGTGRVNAYKALQSCNTPNKPSIEGESSGKAGEDYEYSFMATDLDGHNITYFIDWGDNTSIETFGPSPSGLQVKVSHTWDEQGNYMIKAKTKDIYELESDWATLEVSMPKNRIISQFILVIERLIERFPFFEFLLQSC